MELETLVNLAGMAFLANLEGLSFKIFQGRIPLEPPLNFSPYCATRNCLKMKIVVLQISLRVFSGKSHLNNTTQSTFAQVLSDNEAKDKLRSLVLSCGWIR